MTPALMVALALVIFAVPEPNSVLADPLKYQRAQDRRGDKAKGKDRGSAVFRSLGNIQNNPRYRGRVLGTHLRPAGRNSNGFVFEVRILRPDDRVILVYVDPRTGKVIGDVLR